MGAIGNLPVTSYHHTALKRFRIRWDFSFSLSSEHFKCAHEIVSCTEYINTHSVYIGDFLGERKYICKRWRLNRLSLKFLWGWGAFLLLFSAYSFHLLFCGHSDLSYVANFPNVLSANKQLLSKTWSMSAGFSWKQTGGIIASPQIVSSTFLEVSFHSSLCSSWGEMTSLDHYCSLLFQRY